MLMRRARPRQARAFSLVELLVVVAIMVVLATVALANLSSRKNSTDLTSASKQIAALLREAQSNAMAQEGGTVWGMHFENATATAPFFALFSSRYSPTTTVGFYRLPAGVAYQPATLPSGTSRDVTFAEITGAASASTSIGLYMPSNPAFSSTITIASSGAVLF